MNVLASRPICFLYGGGEIDRFFMFSGVNGALICQLHTAKCFSFNNLKMYFVN